MAVIECQNLIKIHKQGTLEVVALQGLDFAMSEGEFVAVVGKSGAGKSTLLKILAGMEKPSAGAVAVAGLDLTDVSSRELVQHYRSDIGFLWQDFTRNLLPYLNAVKNVEVPMLLAGVGRKARRTRALALLDAVGLRSQAFANVGTMSGGEQQRLAMCVALAMAPTLLLADEPTGELDTVTSIEIYELLRRLCAEAGLSVLVVTHDVALAQRADRVVRLADGRMLTERKLGRTVDSLAVDSAGSVRIPYELLIQTGITDRVTAEVVEDGLLLRPEEDSDGA
ncbi:MAG: ATP-binding cassette domain-containing protein [Acidimicrobiia bacterium]|nr:ATP-binding cassette domain-containing protein [Acidimicrobiia bacterium]